MIMDFSRRYRKIIFWGLIILVGVPFIFVTTSNRLPFVDWFMGNPVEYGAVASAGDVPVTADEYRQAIEYTAQQMSPDKPMRDYTPLIATGEADRILESLIDSKLMEQEVQRVDLAFDRDYLDESLKKDPTFQNEKGEFDPQAWNDWVRENKQQNIKWDAIRESVADSVRRRVLMDRIMASSRVREAELRKEFEKRHTAVKVKYLPIQLAVQPTEEQIKAHYEANKSRYDLPAQRRAEFVALSVEPPRPAALDDLVQRARQGEEFDALSKTQIPNVNIFAAPTSDWTAEDKALPDQAALFTMTAGQVTDPVQTTTGYAIYKVIEERTNTDTGKKEVRFQALHVFPQLSPEERTALKEKADAVAAQALANGDLAAAATQAGLFVQTTEPFSTASESIANVPAEDTAAFAQGVAQVEQGKVSEVISGRKNLYVAKVTEVVPPVPQPLEAVHDKVLQDTIAEMRQGPDYMRQLSQIAQEVPAKAKTLEDIKTLYPNIDAEIKETGPFTASTYDWSSGPLWNPEDVVPRLVEAGPGKLVGPLRTMDGVVFAQLVEATPPDQKAWTDDYPKEKDRLRSTIVASRQSERFQDYLSYLKQSGEIPIRRNEEAIKTALGLNEKKDDKQDEAKKDDAKKPTPAEAGTPAPNPVTAPFTPGTPTTSPAAKVPDGSVPSAPADANVVAPAAPGAVEAPVPPAPEAVPPAEPVEAAPPPAAP